MSTPPSRNAVLMQWWMSLSSMSDSKEACVRAIRSASPVVSTTTLAKTAWRPSLLSKMAPLTTLPSRIGAVAQACSTRRTLASPTICIDRVLSASGSTVGDQVTMPWKAAVRCAQ